MDDRQYEEMTQYRLNVPEEINERTQIRFTVRNIRNGWECVSNTCAEVKVHSHWAITKIFFNIYYFNISFIFFAFASVILVFHFYSKMCLVMYIFAWIGKKVDNSNFTKIHHCRHVNVYFQKPSRLTEEFCLVNFIVVHCLWNAVWLLLGREKVVVPVHKACENVNLKPKIQ